MHESTKTRFRTRQIWIKIWAPLVLIVSALAMCITVTVDHSQAFSPIDEWVYYDYLVKLPQEGVVHQGEHLSRDALQRMSCNGQKALGTMGSPCGGDYSDYAAYPYKGKTSADAYTPLYFGVTWAIGKAISFVTGLGFLTAARLTGFFWLVAGLLLFYRLARDMAVPKLAAVAVGLGFVASTFAWWTYTYVSTDASAFVFGALMLLVTVRFLRRRLSGWWLLPIGVLAVLFKVTNIFAVGMSVLVLAFYGIGRAYARRRERISHPASEALSARRPRPSAGPTTNAAPGTTKLVVIASTMTVATIAAELIWLQIRAAIAVGSPPYQEILSGPVIDWNTLGNLTTLLLPRTILSNVVLQGSATYAYSIPQLLVIPFSWLLIAGVLAYVFKAGKRRLDTTLSLAILVGAVTFAPILSVAMALIQGITFEIPPRYGAALLPGFLIAAALLIKGRVASWTVLSYAGMLLLFVLVTAHHYAW